MHALRDLLLCALVPVAQAVILHAAFRRSFGPNNFVFGSYSWDVLPLLAGAAAYCFVHLHRQQLLIPRLARKLILPLLSTSFLLVLVLWRYASVVRYLGPVAATALLLGTALAWLALGALLFLLPTANWRVTLRRQSPRFFYAALGFAALAGLPAIQEYCWLALSRVTGILAFLLIKLTGTPVKLHVSPYISLDNPYFFADVKQPCSGLEGISYFFFFYSLVRVVEGFALRPRRELQLGLIGFATVIFLNALRIALLFVFAVNARRYLSSRAVSDAFVWAFHSHVGWLLYLAGLLVFFRLVFRLRPGASFQSEGAVH